VVVRRFSDDKRIYYPAVFPFGSHESLGSLGEGNAFLKYFLCPIFVLLSPILVPFRLAFIVAAFLLAATLTSLLSLGTDPSKPLPRFRWWLLTRMLNFLARLCLLVLGIRLRIHGKEKLAKTSPDIVVMNHTSVLDLFLFVIACPGSPIAKDSVLKIGVVKCILLAMRGLTVSRGKTAQALDNAIRNESTDSSVISSATVSDISSETGERSNTTVSAPLSPQDKGTYRLMRERIAARRRSKGGSDWPHILIFPEGTTKLETALLRFHTSAFRLMLEDGATILPVAVRMRGARRMGYATSRIHEHLLNLLLNPVGVADVFFMDPVAADWNTGAIASGATAISSLARDQGIDVPAPSGESGSGGSAGGSVAQLSPRIAADVIGMAMAERIGVPYLPYTNGDSFWFFSVKARSKVSEDYATAYQGLGTEEELRKSLKHVPLTGITLPDNWRAIQDEEAIEGDKESCM